MNIKSLMRFSSIALLLCLILGTLSNTALAIDSSLTSSKADESVPDDGRARSTTITLTSTTMSKHFPFKDVNKNDWYYDAVQYVYDNHMMSGADSTSFAPNNTTTRGMLVTILHRLEGTPSASGTGFKDVADGQWFADAVVWASANGIVSGYDQGMFKPDAAVTREQLAAILYRYSQYKGYNCSISGNISGFKDVAQVSSYAMDSMRWAMGNGLISGVGNNELSPKGNATRAQVAAILMRYHNNIVLGNNTVSHTPMSDASDAQNNTAQYYDQYREIVKQREAAWEIGSAKSNPYELERFDNHSRHLQGVAVIRLLDMNNDGTDELIMGYSKLDFQSSGTYADAHAEVWTYDGEKAVKLFDKQSPVHGTDISVWMTLANIDGEWLIVSGWGGDGSEYTYWGIRNGSISAVHNLSAIYDYNINDYILSKDGKVVSQEVFSAAQNAWAIGEENYPFNYIDGSEKANAILEKTAEARQKLGLETETPPAAASAVPDVTSTPAWSGAYYSFILEGGYLKSGQTYYTADGDSISFSLHDMDNNGIPELIVLNGGPSEAQRTYYVYACKEGSVVYMGTTSYRASEPVYAPGTQYPGIFDESLSTGIFQGTYYYMKDGKYLSESVYYGVYDNNGENKYQDTSDNKLYELYSNAFVGSSLKEGLVSLKSATISEILSKGWEVFIIDWKK